MLGGGVKVAGSGVGGEGDSGRVVVVSGVSGAVKDAGAAFVASKCSGSRVVRFKM